MQESTELKNLLERTYEGMSSRDAAFVEGHVVHAEEALIIGTDPGEWLMGWESIQRTLIAEMQQLREARISLLAGNPQAFNEGDFGWVADQPRFHFPDGREVPARLTAVCQREGGEWKFVQLHLSLGVPNDQLLHPAG